MKISKLNLVRILLWIILIVSFVLITQKYPLILLYDMPEATFIDFLLSIIYFSSVITLSLLSKFKRIKFIVVQIIFALILISYLILLSKDVFISMLIYAVFIVPFFAFENSINFNPIYLILGFDAIISLCMILSHIYRKKFCKK